MRSPIAMPVASEHPTLLERPMRVGWHHTMSTEYLYGRPRDYEIRQAGEIWVVVAKGQGVVVYAGPGPVRVFRSPAPF